MLGAWAGQASNSTDPEDSETSLLMSTNFSIGHIGELQLLMQSRGCADATGEEAEEEEEEEQEES